MADKGSGRGRRAFGGAAAAAADLDIDGELEVGPDEHEGGRVRARAAHRARLRLVEGRYLACCLQRQHGLASAQRPVRHLDADARTLTIDESALRPAGGQKGSTDNQ